MDPRKTYDYLTQARARVLGSVRPLSPEQYRRRFPFGLGTIASTLAHIMISEWYYVERLTGRTVPPYAQWPIKYEAPPDFAVVDATWSRQAAHVRAALAEERDWNRTVAYESFPNSQGRRFTISATAGDFFMQLALHEVHHRAQIMAMLRQLGEGVTPVEDVDYNDLMFTREEIA